MKKFIAVLLLAVSGFAYAAMDEGDYSPIYVSSAGTKVGTLPITFNNLIPGDGRRNCITDLSASANNFPPAGFTVAILDGNTTAYMITQSTMSLIESWYTRNPLCLSLNTTTYLNIVGQTGTTFRINASGYEKTR